MNLIREFNKPLDTKSIILLCVFKDEHILLEYFVTYYTSIGITHFICIDNGSTDGGFEYIKQLDENIMLFQNVNSYKDANYGVDWIHITLEKYCKNKWCLVVDMDELVYIDNLNYLISNMKKEHSTLCRFLLLDMYSKNINKYKKGDPFLYHSNYFDKYMNTYHTKNRSLTNPNYGIWGGVRKRILNVDACLIKRSFFYNHFSDVKLSCGYHWLCTLDNKHIDKSYVKEYSKIEYLFHFKFIKPNFSDFIDTQIKSNQHWDNSSEYKKYKQIKLNRIYNPKISIQIHSKKQLDKIFSPIHL